MLGRTLVWFQREGCGLGEASTSSTSILTVKRMERRNRGMESIRDTGRFLSALDLLELLLMVPSTVFGLLANFT